MPFATTELTGLLGLRKYWTEHWFFCKFVTPPLDLDAKQIDYCFQVLANRDCIHDVHHLYPPCCVLRD
jgi:hypothetical protein